MASHGAKAWLDLSRTLAVSDGDHFARLCLRALQLIWPDLVESPRMKGLDRSGIDLLVWSDDERLPVAVQCKGYEKQHTGKDQLYKARQSIRAFLKSGIRAEHYFFVHNRDNRTHLAEDLEPLREECVASGAALHAEILDRPKLVDRIFDHVTTEVRTAIRSYSQTISERLDRLFAFRAAHLAIVPIRERTARFHRTRAPEMDDASGSARRDIADVIGSSSGTRWTILTGTFGTGKTTSALAAARTASAPMLFVPAASIPSVAFHSGKRSDIMLHVNELLGVADDEGDTSPTSRSRIASSVLAQILRKPRSDVAFILDGLDEHHALAAPEGFAKLFNQLADCRGPVILTTRREHFDAMIGSFNCGIGDLAQRHGYSRTVRVLELLPWTLDDTAIVVQRAIAIAGTDVALRLQALHEALRRGEATAFYGDLLTYPLFVQFIIEDVAESGLRRTGRAELVRSFIERKLRRDLVTETVGGAERRVAIDDTLDPEEAIARTMDALAELAGAMVRRQGERFVLTESIDSMFVESVFARHFGKRVPIVPILLNSVLITRGPRVGARLAIGFPLRILQEYLLAAHIEGTSLDWQQYPSELLQFRVST